jgi:hypothetical protein
MIVHQIGACTPRNEPFQNSVEKVSSRIGIGLVSVTVNARPEKIDSMPSVTRKEGIRILVTSKPETAPMMAPIASTIGGATKVGTSRS